MSRLVLKRFRVTNYRNIDDSGWIPVDRVAAFVGRNESGKTTLLKALHKFNPATDDPYRPQREFPRDRYLREFRRASDWPVCAVEFDVSPTFRVEINQRLGVTAPDTIVATRYYDGTLRLRYEATVPDAPLPASELNLALENFAKSARRLPAPSFDRELQVQQLRTELSAWAIAKKDQTLGIRDLKSEAGTSLLAQIRAELEQKTNPLAADVIQALTVAIDGLLAKAGSQPAQSQLDAVIQAELPVFIYFENYGILESAIYLPRFLEDLAKTPNDPRTRTVHALFKHVGLSPKEVAELGGGEAAAARSRGDRVTDEMIQRDQERKELRSLKLNSASLAITEGFAAWFGQRRYQIRYDADGDHFRIWISDDRRPGVEIELESRSKGFQWFFSFYLVFLVESGEGHKNAVLLLDEPGLNLHPTAQQKLIEFLDRLASNNPLLYTTHSPFLVDGRNLQRMMPVHEDGRGHSQILVGGWPKDRDTTFALQAAAAFGAMRSMFDRRLNVLVEDFCHVIYLQVLNTLCRAAGMEALAEEVQVTPCGGARFLMPMLALFGGYDARAVALIDDGEDARLMRQALVKAFADDGSLGLVSMSEVMGFTGADLEDVLGEAVVVPMVAELLGQAFELDSADRRQGGLTEQIRAAATRLHIDMPDGWRTDAARRVAYAWSTKWPEEVPIEVLERAQALFRVLNQRLDPVAAALGRVV